MPRPAVKNENSLAWLNIGQALITNLMMGGAMAYSVWGWSRGQFTAGDVVLVNTLLAQLFRPLDLLGMVYRTVRQGVIDMAAMFNLVDTAPEVVDQPGAPPLAVGAGHVRFEGVRFGYEDDRQILKGVDIAIPPGRTVAIVGPSGAGKSTLGRLLFRFYDPQAGRILIDGQDIRRVAQTSLRAAIGIVPQDSVLFNDTIGYNIAYGREGASHEEVVAAARGAAIHDFIESLPQGYDTEVGERGLKLSGGEKQRVAIARTLLKDPPILLLDEATSALDSRTEAEIQSVIKRVERGRSTLVIAHRLSTIADADEIVVMDGGRVVERGRHAQLLDAGRPLCRDVGPPGLRARGGRRGGRRRVTTATLDIARDRLRHIWGHADFRGRQPDVIERVLAGRDTLAVMPTGAGKSVTYQLPALIRQGTGLVVSPLIALMHDQVAAARALGIRAAALTSADSDGPAVARAFSAGELDLLYVAPERATNEGFQRLLERTPLSLIAVDEAHCVSEWGHDFRPDYRLLRPLLDRFDAPRVALTATADAATRADILRQLGIPQDGLVLAGFDRPNITYAIRPRGRLSAQLAQVVRDHPGPGIVYAPTRAATERLAAGLSRDTGRPTRAYHAGLPAEERAANQSAFVASEDMVMVATRRLCMGIDKPDVRFVAHAAPAQVDRELLPGDRPGGPRR